MFFLHTMQKHKIGPDTAKMTELPLFSAQIMQLVELQEKTASSKITENTKANGNHK